MFIGHLAPALAARALTDEAPKLGVLFLGAQLVDIAFFSFALVGLENFRISPGITAMSPLDLYDYPFTHSLLGSAIWAIGFAIVIGLAQRNLVAASWAGIVVISHWVLDWLTHRPDLTISGSGQTYGLGLWNYPLAAISIELGFFGVAFWLYLRRTKGPVGPPIIMLALLLAMQAFAWFGPEPVSAGPGFMILGLISFVLMICLGTWVSSTRWHRTTVGLGVASPPP